MRVWIDGQIFTRQRFGGISRYFSHLAPALTTLPATDVDIGVWLARSEHLEWPGTYTNAQLARVPRSVLDLLNRPKEREARQSDLVHHTFYAAANLTLASYSGIPRVCTVYDMIPELFPDLFPRGNPHCAKREYVESCDGVIAISRSSLRDLEHFYGTLDKPVAITHLGVDGRFRVPGTVIEGLPADYVLFVGERRGYKDFRILVCAFAAALPDRQGGPSLLCVGGGPFDDVEEELLETAGVRGRVMQRDLDDAQMPTAYRRASLFCFPSRYEGFGLPVLEAFASGCPTVTSDAEALVEVGEEGAAIFPAGDADVLAEVMGRTLKDLDNTAAMVERARARAGRATWGTTARQTRSLYQEVLQT